MRGGQVHTARMKRVPAAAVWLLATCAGVQAQVLTTAETLGKGKSGLLFSDNRIFVDGARLHLLVGQYVRGLSGRFDVYIVAGATRTDDEDATSVITQGWVGGGGNVSLAEWKGFRMSAFGVVSTALNRRTQASDVLANPAVVVSRTAIKDRLALYGGINALVPIGHREQGWFTPPETEVNVPVGALIMLGRWGVFAEADIGHLMALGFGLARSL
jgi:hypothetical protein